MSVILATDSQSNADNGPDSAVGLPLKDTSGRADHGADLSTAGEKNSAA